MNKYCKSIGTKKQAVVSEHPIANHIGKQILNSGGNAFDAFVAVTAVQYVLSEGVTSLAGPLGALLYDSKSNKCYYLDAGFNSPLDPKGKEDVTGTRVPGAPAGLEAISKKFGKLPFDKVLEPAIQLARKGFKLNSLHAWLISSAYGKKLKKSMYGKKTFFPDNKPLVKGDILKLPEVANVLQSLATQGSRYMYQGQWAEKVVRAVRKKGGLLTMKDFSEYKIVWRDPLTIPYRSYKIYSPSGRTFGGLVTLLALKALENIPLKSFDKHYSNSADVLEILVRIENEAEKIVDAFSLQDFDNKSFIQNSIEKTANDIWNLVQNKTNIDSSTQGNHSYHVIVIDKEGNTITGTNSIQSLAWGEGIFVEGVPLTASGKLTPYYTNPGERELSALSMHIGMKNSKISFASGAFSSSLIPAEFQFIVNIIDYKLSAKKATTMPRFGTTAVDLETQKPTEQDIWLDPRVKKDIVNNLYKRGLRFDQKNNVDTGLGSVAIVKPKGLIESAIVPLDV